MGNVLNRFADTIDQINQLCETYAIDVTHTRIIENKLYEITTANEDNYVVLVTLLENGWKPTIVTHTVNSEAFLRVSFYFE